MLARFNQEIEEKVAAVDEALRDMEDDIAEEMGAQQQAEASKWRRAREKRDAGLEALDQHATTGALPEGLPEGRSDVESGFEPGQEEADQNEDAGDMSDSQKKQRRQQRRRIEALTDALRTLKTQHHEMALLEAQLAPSSRRGSGQGTRAEQLGRVRL